MALAKEGMDLFAVQFSAQRFGNGLSSHFIDLETDGKIYPYSMRGVTQAYGNLITVLMLPFRNVDFQNLRISWFILAVSMLIFLWIKIFEVLGPSLPKASRFAGALTVLSLSGSVSLLLERGQLEVLVPFLLFFFWREYRIEKVTWVGAFLLGLVIHAKIWPILLLLLLLHRRSWKALMIAAGTPLVLTLITTPWFPLLEYLRAVRGIGDVTSEMRGWAGVSLLSFLSLFNLSLKWRVVSAIWLAIASGLILLVDQRLTKVSAEPRRRDLIFALTLVCSALAPGYLCDYCMISALFLLPSALDMEWKWIAESVVAVVLSNLLFFNYYAGILKAAALLVFVLFSILTIWRSFVPVQSPVRSPAAIL